MQNDDQLSGLGIDRPLGREWLFVVLALLTLGALRLFLVFKGAPLNSDDVMPAMLFESLRKGLGSGWFFTPDTFLISDFPLYVISFLVFGSTAAVAWGTAITLSSFSLLMIAMGVNKAIGQMEALVFAIIGTASFVLGNAADVLLATPFIHVMTMGFSIWLASTVIKGFFDSVSINWPKLTVLAVCASLMELSDPLSSFIFVIPLGIVGLWYVVSNKNKKSALWSWLFVIEVVVLFSALGRLIIEHSGNTILPLGVGIVPHYLLGFHVRLLVAAALNPLNLLGANFIGEKMGYVVLLDLVKLAAVGYFLVYVLYKYRAKRLDTPRQAFVAYLVVMGATLVSAFIVSTYVMDIKAQRYLFPAIIAFLVLVSVGVADHFRRYKKALPAVLICPGFVRS